MIWNSETAVREDLNHLAHLASVCNIILSEGDVTLISITVPLPKRYETPRSKEGNFAIFTKSFRYFLKLVNVRFVINSSNTTPFWLFGIFSFI